MKRLLILVASLVLVTMACRSVSQPEAANNISALPAQPIAVSYEKLDSGVIYTGSGVVNAISIACECSLREFENIGVLVMRGETQVLYIPDIRTLNNMAAFENTSFFTAQQGDTVYFGKVKSVAKAVQYGTPTAETSFDQNGNELVTLSGGNMHQPIFIGMGTDRSSWHSPICGGRLFATVDEAYAFAIQ